MTNDSDESNGQSGAGDWSRAWFDFVGRLTAAGASLSPDTAAPAAARHMRDAFFKAMSAQAEEYMRSPEFLGLMKSSMDGAIAWRTQMNEFLRQAHREARIPTQEDIEDMAGRLQQLQRHVSERLETIEKQLEAVLEKLNASGTATAPRPKPKTTSSRSAKASTIRPKKSGHR